MAEGKTRLQTSFEHGGLGSSCHLVQRTSCASHHITSSVHPRSIKQTNNGGRQYRWKAQPKLSKQ